MPSEQKAGSLASAPEISILNARGYRRPMGMVLLRGQADPSLGGRELIGGGARAGERRRAFPGQTILVT
jgi:hypothetical protein